MSIHKDYEGIIFIHGNEISICYDADDNGNLYVNVPTDIMIDELVKSGHVKKYLKTQIMKNPPESE